MRVNRVLAVVLMITALVVLAACGGGGEPEPTIRIVSINLNPGTATAGSIIELSASISAPGQSISSLIKNWTVTGGSISTAPPDFSMLLRETAKVPSELSVSTTSNTVFWVTPEQPESVTITVSVETETENKVVQVTASPITLSVSSGTGGTKVCRVNANSVTDLYFAAFRINFTSAWSPTTVEAGDFMGDEEDILFLGLTDQNGFVPCAITKRGDVAGEDGSGLLATITFEPASGTSAARDVGSLPFELAVPYLINSFDRQIPVSSR